MKLSKLTFLLATSVVLLLSSAIASAREINVEAGDVRINVDSGRTRVRTSPYRTPYRTWDRYYRQNSYCSRSQNFSRQESMQMSRSDRRIVQTRIATTRCR